MFIETMIKLIDYLWLFISILSILILSILLSIVNDFMRLRSIKKREKSAKAEKKKAISAKS